MSPLLPSPRKKLLATHGKSTIAPSGKKSFPRPWSHPLKQVAAEYVTYRTSLNSHKDTLSSVHLRRIYSITLEVNDKTSRIVRRCSGICWRRSVSTNHEADRSVHKQKTNGRPSCWQWPCKNSCYLGFVTLYPASRTETNSPKFIDAAGQVFPVRLRVGLVNINWRCKRWANARKCFEGWSLHAQVDMRSLASEWEQKGLGPLSQAPSEILKFDIFLLNF